MRHSPSWVPSSEVAFIAGLTDKEINRAVDEDVLPHDLVDREDGRQFARIVGPFAKFYFATSNDLSKSLRRSVIEILTHRLMSRGDSEVFLALHFPLSAFDWKVKLPFGLIELSDFVLVGLDRAASVERANRSITEDPAVMGGVPVFAGTRVPIEIVTSSKAAGIGDDRLREAYSFLTSELIQDAEVYQQVHSRRGRPRKLADANPTWKVQSTKIIRPGSSR